MHVRLQADFVRVEDEGESHLLRARLPQGPMRHISIELDPLISGGQRTPMTIGNHALNPKVACSASSSGILTKPHNVRGAYIVAVHMQRCFVVPVHLNRGEVKRFTGVLLPEVRKKFRESWQILCPSRQQRTCYATTTYGSERETKSHVRAAVLYVVP